MSPSDKGKPIMEYVMELENRVREMKEQHNDDMWLVTKIVTVKNPISLAIGVGIGAVLMFLAIFLVDKIGGR